MSGEIRPAGRADLPAMAQLLEQSRLPTEGMADHVANYLVAEGTQSLSGMVGLEVYESVGLLRSLAVTSDEQGRGLGAELVRAVLAQARGKRLEAVYLLTLSAEHYFPRFGFEPIPREEVDPRLGASAELQGACPQTAVCMKLQLY